MPAYMIPAYFVPLATLPLNASGKIARQLLPDPATAPDDDADVTPARVCKAPSTMTGHRQGTPLS